MANVKTPKWLSSSLRFSAVDPLVWRCWVLAYAVLLFVGLKDVLDFRLPGNDDLMRLQEVRDFLAGQAWADTDQHRFVSPEGGQMHFSRLPDVIMGALLLIARPFAGEHGAELFMLLAFPALAMLAFLATANNAMRDVDESACFPHMMITIMLAPVLAQFHPGRIDHHGLQIFLSMLALLSVLRAQASPRWGAVTAGVIIVMMAIGMETAPVAAIAAIGAGFPWLMDGEKKILSAFGVTLLAASPAMLFLLKAGGPVFQPACDSYSVIHVEMALLAGAGAVGLAASSKWLDTRLKRLVAGALAGGVAAALIVKSYPQCLAGPFGAVDAELIREWLDGLSASRNAAELFAASKSQFLVFYASSIVGFFVAVYLRMRAAPEKRRTWTLILLFSGTGLLVSLWMLRAGPFVAAFTAIPPAVVIAAAYRRVDYARPRTVLPFLASIFLISPLSGYLGAAMFQKGSEKNSSPITAQGRANIDSKKTRQSCQADVTNFAYLDEVPAGIVLNQIDIGPEVLALSHHSIIAAPYHRNTKGILQSLEFFTASPDAAEEMAMASGAEYVIICPTSGETSYFSRLYPDSLNVALRAGEIPAWLERVDTGDAPFRFFRIVRDETRRR